MQGVPVVTLPAGLVAREAIIMTSAQRTLHEQLRLKHSQLQRQIMAQQEELRRISEQLLLVQYGASASTVLKVRNIKPWNVSMTSTLVRKHDDARKFRLLSIYNLRTFQATIVIQSFND